MYNMQGTRDVKSHNTQGNTDMQANNSNATSVHYGCVFREWSDSPNPFSIGKLSRSSADRKGLTIVNIVQCKRIKLRT